MKIGAIYPQTEAGGDPRSVRKFGLAMEAMGLNHLIVYDHVVGASHDREPKLLGPYTEHDPFHDPFMVLSYLSAITETIELVTGVLILPQRQTVLVAKQATDLDLLSGERLRLGVGIGWNYVEYDALGEDFHTRGARIDEQIPYLRRLWNEPLLSFEGRFDRIDKGNLNIRPKRQIPIWIGGYSEAAFQRGARLGDGFIFGGWKYEQLKAGAERLTQLLAEAGRSGADYGRDYVPLSKGGGPQDMADELNRWRDLGGTHASILTMQRELKTIEQHIDFVGEVLRRL